jgi:cobalt-zinc-cadmium efflux system membrane fusion protein
MNPNKKYFIFLVCVLLLAGCGDQRIEPADTHQDTHEGETGRGHEDGDEDERSESIALTAAAYDAAGIVVAPVGLEALVPTIQVTGTLSYDERYMAIATARIGGRITKTVVDYGQQVSAGDVLAWIDSPELGAAQAEYGRAVSMSRLKKAEYERSELLLQGRAISLGEKLRREADWRSAEADVQTVEHKLHIIGLSQEDVNALATAGNGGEHAYPVRATVDGRITERNAVPGRVVSAEDELFTVAKLNTLWLFLQVFEKDLPAIKEGAKIILACEAHPEDRFLGSIDYVGQVLDSHTRTISARAVIDNPQGKLMPGMFVYADIEAGHGHDSTDPHLAAPREAITSIDGRDVVFVETTERSFEIRPVVLGENDSDWVEIHSGLTAGEKIAISGVFTLKSEAQKGGLEEHHH